MSRVGKRPINVPAGVTIEQNNLEVKISGPKGELKHHLQPGFELVVEAGTAHLHIVADDPRNKLRALHGLYNALITNAVVGVSQGFQRQLIMKGVGYRAQVQGEKLQVMAGYSNPILMDIPAGLAVNCPDPTTINIAGPDKQIVGQFASDVRDNRPPEPYKGKGIYRSGEKVRLKAGKSGKK